MDIVPEPAHQSVEHPTEHPPWCQITDCSAADGGAHHSKIRIIAETDGRMLLVDLYEAVHGLPLVRITENRDDNIVFSTRLSLFYARALGNALKDLAAIGRRAER